MPRAVAPPAASMRVRQPKKAEGEALMAGLKAVVREAALGSAASPGAVALAGSSLAPQVARQVEVVTDAVSEEEAEMDVDAVAAGASVAVAEVGGMPEAPA